MGGRAAKMETTNGYIYIFTNPSFPEYVKIGYADDINIRLAQLNRSECVPFAFRVYATYKVDTRLTDTKLHNMIDKINPTLRAIDNVDGKKRVREFYAMSAEDAYMLLEAMAEIHGTQDKLKLYKPTKKQEQEDRMAEEVKVEYEKAKPLTFSEYGIPIGATLEYCNRGNEDSGKTCTVIDEKSVEYDGESWSLSRLAKALNHSKYPVQGPKYFKYNGEWLTEIRKKLGN